MVPQTPRWADDGAVGLSALGLYRDGSGQDVGRATVEAGWQRRYVTGFGLVNKFDALLRGDVYNVTDRETGLSVSDKDGMHSRGFAQANWEVSYPFVKRLEESQFVVAPVASVTAGTNVDFDDHIPNEDSQDFTLDPTNLFEPNRFSGYDLIEDRSHATYGLRTGWYSDNGYKGEVFFGQSHRFDNDDNPFSAGSGRLGQQSDYVGLINIGAGEYFNLDYRFSFRTSISHHAATNWMHIQSWAACSWEHNIFIPDSLQETDWMRAASKFGPPHA